MTARLGLSAKLVLLLTVFAIVPLIVMAVIVNGATEHIKSGVGSQLQALAKRVADTIDRNLFERYGDVQAFGLNTLVQDRQQWYKPPAESALAQAMNRYVDTYDIYSLTILVDLEGRVISVNSKDADGKPIESAFVMDKNYREASWFKDCLAKRFTTKMPFTAAGNDQSTGTVIEDFHVDPDVQRAYSGDDGYTIGFSAPVYNADGQMIAIWSNRSKFSNIENVFTQIYAESIERQPGLELTLLNNDGLILVDSIQKVGGQYTVKHDPAIINKFNLAAAHSGARNAVAGTDGHGTYAHTRNGSSQLAGYVHLRGAMGYPGMNWSILARVPTDTLGTVAGTTAIQRNVYLTLAGALVAVLIGGFIASRRFTRPIRHVCEQMDQAAEKLANAAAQVAATSQSLASGATEQAASVQQTSSAIEGISQQTNRSAETATDANGLAGAARDSAAAGQTTMNELDSAMTAINNSAGEIRKIIKVIEEIAFQTNLLALNAAVEAARAGEQGRGFAVVAEEVRNLAQRSASAAKDTNRLIADAVSRAADGSQVAGSARTALGEINNRVSKVAEMLTEIQTSATQQASGVEQISQALSQIDKVTQSSAAGAEECSAAAQELSSLTQGLRTEVVQNLMAVVTGTRRAATAASQGG